MLSNISAALHLQSSSIGFGAVGYITILDSNWILGMAFATDKLATIGQVSPKRHHFQTGYFIYSSYNKVCKTWRKSLKVIYAFKMVKPNSQKAGKPALSVHLWMLLKLKLFEARQWPCTCRNALSHLWTREMEREGWGGAVRTGGGAGVIMRCEG